MIYRNEYRACLKNNIDEAQFSKICDSITNSVDEKFLEIMLYRHHNMLFLYYEARIEKTNPEEFLADLNSFLETWPLENGLTHWAYMYPVFYHQTSIEDEALWNKERLGDVKKTKVGRIAFLKNEKLFSYVYWHTELVNEGLLKGDKYQYISLHENILFSYYEEPRNNISISGKNQESEAIKSWLALDPGSHFQLDKTDGEHFKVLPPIISYYHPSN